MPFHHNVSGTWKDCVVWHNVSGTWKRAALWHNVAGTWKQISTNALVDVRDAAYTDGGIAPDTVTVKIEFRNTGGFYKAEGNGVGLSLVYNWLLGGSASAYDIRLTPTGSTLTGSAVNTWLNLATTRNWTLTRSTFGSSYTSCFIEIRDASTLAVLDSGTVTLDINIDL